MSACCCFVSGPCPLEEEPSSAAGSLTGKCIRALLAGGGTPAGRLQALFGKCVRQEFSSNGCGGPRCAEFGFGRGFSKLHFIGCLPFFECLQAYDSRVCKVGKSNRRSGSPGRRLISVCKFAPGKAVRPAREKVIVYCALTTFTLVTVTLAASSWATPSSTPSPQYILPKRL